MSLHQAYPTQYTAPIRKQLQEHGIKELLTQQDVEQAIDKDKILVLINSVCGCAAANARPALYNLDTDIELATVFAGVHHEATAKLREHIEHEPSSPSFALFENGECTYFMPRSEIEGASAQEIAAELREHLER